MSKEIQSYINNARQLQRYEEYESAISLLQEAQLKDLDKEHEVEIQKLLSFNYRKMGYYDLALFHINNAINQNVKYKNKQNQTEYAICLMNKGIVYEECKCYERALNCYIDAVNIFILLYGNTPEEYGLIINSLFTLGLCYYNHKDFGQAKDVLESALEYFTDSKETDQRYLAINDMLREINI